MKNFERIKFKDDEEILSIIRGALDHDKYHLNVTMGNNGNGFFVKSWALYHNYKFSSDYFNEKNGPIMTSEQHTIKDLYEYAQLHERKDLHKVWHMCSDIVLFIMVTLVLIQVAVPMPKQIASIIFGYVIGSAVTNFIFHLVNLAITVNSNVDYMELLEASVENSIVSTSMWKDMDDVDAQGAVSLAEKLMDKVDEKDINNKDHNVDGIRIGIDMGVGKDMQADGKELKSIKYSAEIAEKQSNSFAEIAKNVKKLEEPTLEIEKNNKGVEFGTKSKIIVDEDHEMEKMVKNKPIAKKRTYTKRNVKETTNVAKTAQKGPKKGIVEGEKLAKGVRKAGVSSKKLNKETTEKKKPGRYKKVD